MAHATNPYSPTSVPGKRLVAQTEVLLNRFDLSPTILQVED